MLKEYIRYLKNNPDGHWFKAKLYGWGWTPATWQGFTVLFVYIALIVLFAFTIDETSPPREIAFTFALPVILLTIAVIRICHKKGEKPRWQWGPPKK
jgi:hypothetical protein